MKGSFSAIPKPIIASKVSTHLNTDSAGFSKLYKSCTHFAGDIPTFAPLLVQTFSNVSSTFLVIVIEKYLDFFALLRM